MLVDRKGFAVEVRHNDDNLSRTELENLAQTFEYGVASGDPLADRVIIWTRVSGANGSVPVQWQVALDQAFSQIVAEGQATAEPARDFTVKIDAELPFPGTTYYYRFFARDTWSMIGRTRTTPAVKQNIRFAVVSCSSIWSGYFNTYEALARRNDLDAILHVGDYIYDFVDDDEKRNMPADVINTQSPFDLETFRQRYRFYRKDPYLRHAHQQHPWVIVWDNHDIESDANGRASSTQAFHEWVPIRSPEPGNNHRIYRKLSFGPMLDLIMLDTRHIGRGTTSQATGSVSILGDQQFDWLRNQLIESQAHWKVLGNQVLLAACKIFGQPISKSMWDGYPADRDRVLRAIADHGIQNTLVVTGDAHLSFAANLEIDGRSAAVELLPSSVTRGNLDEQVKGIFTKIAAGGFAAAVKLFNPHIRYFESTRHGYGIVDLKEAGATLEFWYVPHEEQSQDQEMARAVYVASGSQRMTNENAPASQGAHRAGPAPDEPRLHYSPGEVGGIGGEYFDDGERLQLRSRLAGIKVRSGDRIDALAVRYEDGSSYSHGGNGGSERGIDLNAGEYFRRITLGVGKHSSTVSIHYFKITTSSGRVFEVGKNPGSTMEFVAPAGRHIVGFRGRRGKELDKLGPIYAPDFAD